MRTVLTVLFITLLNISIAQTPDCNQQTRGVKRNIPKDICIPDEYNIVEIFTCGDLNLDGVNDYAFSYSKINPIDGDTTFLAVYYGVTDTTFALKNIFSNICPIIFMRYDLTYTVKDSLLNEIQGLYHGDFPLKSIQFLNGEIQMTLAQGYMESLVLRFSYNSEKDDWLLFETVFTIEYYEKPQINKTKFSGEEQISISEFDYADWL